MGGGVFFNEVIEIMAENNKTGYTGLFKGMNDQVKAESSRIIDEAKKEVEQILQEAKAKVERIEKGEEDEEIVGKKRSFRRRVAKKSTGREQFLLAIWDSKVRYQIFAEAVQKAKESLGEIRKQKDYSDALGRLIKEAVNDCEGCEEIAVHEKDVDLAQKLAKQYNFTQKIIGTNNFSGGAIAIACQGKVKVDNSFDARIEQAIPLVVTEIGNILYGNTEGKAL